MNSDDSKMAEFEGRDTLDARRYRYMRQNITYSARRGPKGKIEGLFYWIDQRGEFCFIYPAGGERPSFESLLDAAMDGEEPK